ncbi:hypothetical protein GCM10010222_57930 [Streptomyces tanashiensis]|nr:hypothetical protein GCM10010222_57930 [Streptomyces tanashiensis]
MTDWIRTCAATSSGSNSAASRATAKPFPASSNPGPPDPTGPAHTAVECDLMVQLRTIEGQAGGRRTL